MHNKQKSVGAHPTKGLKEHPTLPTAPKRISNYTKLAFTTLVIAGLLLAVLFSLLNLLSTAQYESVQLIEKQQNQLNNLTERTALLEQEVINLKAAKATVSAVAQPAVLKTATAPKKKSSTYTITFYCACKECCGKTNGITASGVKAKVGRTVAAPKNIKFGTKLNIDGIGNRVVEDRGGSISGKRIDVFVENHAEALQLGVQKREVSFND